MQDNYGEEEEEEDEAAEPTEERGGEGELPQVMAFSTRGELGRRASELQLTRTPLADLAPGASLADAYAGGRIVSTYSGQLTQGSVVILLQDDACRYVQCVMSGDVTRLLPHSAQLSAGELYVHGAGARVGRASSEFSQEGEVEIVVEGEEGKIWIVSKEARNPSFLPAREPSEFQGRGASGWKTRRQQCMDAAAAGLENVEMQSSKAPTGAVQPPTSKEPSVEPVTTSAGPSTILEDPRNHTQQTSTGQSYVAATHYATGPSPPPSDPQTDTPNTIPSSLHQPSPPPQSPDGVEKREEGEGGDPSSSDEIFSSSDSYPGGPTDSEGEGEGEGQERSLFPYLHTTNTTKQSYCYKRLSELEPGQQKVNVFGMVIDFQPPFQTMGRDFCSIVNVTDESLEEGESVKFTFFHSNRDRLPRVDKVGDVISIHRVNMKLYPTGVQGIGQSFTNCLSFSGQLGSKVKPVTGAVSYTFTPQDRNRVKELRLWYARKSRTVDPFQRALKDITTGVASSDVICQVLSVSQREPASQPRIAVLHVWDGTRTSHRSLDLDLSAFNTTQVRDSELLRISESFAERIVVYGRELVEGAGGLRPGQFVCLENMQEKLHAGQCNSFKDRFDAVELRLQPSSDSDTAGRREARIRTLATGDIEVFELRRRLSKCRKSGEILFRPLPPDIVPSRITQTQHSEQQSPVPLSVLMTVRDASAKFLCVVKVLGIEPCSVEGMVQLRCPVCKNKTAIGTNSTSSAVCPKCPKEKRKRKRKNQSLQPTYFFKLKLADETGHLDAYVSGGQAAKFLAGFPPTVFYRQPLQRVGLLEQLYALTGNNDPFDSNSALSPRPWVAVCLVSMTTGGGQEDMTYHLFDTMLKSTV